MPSDARPRTCSSGSSAKRGAVAAVPSRFRSELDARIVVPLALAIGWLFPAGAWMIMTGRVALGVVLMISGLIPLGAFLPVRYELRDRVLRIRSGLFVWQIPYPLIRSVRPLTSARAAPALSRNRLAIEFETGEGTDRVLVSPKGRRAFLAALHALAPAAEVEHGDGAMSHGA